MVHLRFENQLDFIPRNDDKESGIDKLLDHAQREGWLDDLVQALCVGLTTFRFGILNSRSAK